MVYMINCPFCKDMIISDVCDKMVDVDGQWQCANGHTFVLKFIETIK